MAVWGERPLVAAGLAVEAVVVGSVAKLEGCCELGSGNSSVAVGEPQEGEPLKPAVATPLVDSANRFERVSFLSCCPCPGKRP